MGKSKTFYGVTSKVWECVKATSSKDHGTVYDPPNSNSGTATTDTVVGTVVLGYNLDPSKATIVYTIEKKPFLVSQNQIWDGVQESIDDCAER